jgi:EAL domain-containing protein (putative c-di-GMP-specific phosphodiesterase class I)/GGDEF domain-containing protein
VRILYRAEDEQLRAALAEAGQRMGAEVAEWDQGDRQAPSANGHAPGADDVVVLEAAPGPELDALVDDARRRGAALLLACGNSGPGTEALAGADDWVRLPVSPDELAARIATADRRASASAGAKIPRPAAAELVRYEELLYDRLTGFPTLAVMIERARDILERRGELTVCYIHFVWYDKIEEIYGWQKLDDVLETTAAAVKGFYDQQPGFGERLMMVSHIADDDFILFTQIPHGTKPFERYLSGLSQQLAELVRGQIEEAHGEDLAALCGIYVGTATVFQNPKIRTERLIYRGIREAANAARGAEQWERSRKVADLRETLRDGAVFIEYHPIIVTATEEVYGYEALSRGLKRELRSPEVLFEVAEEANLLWELSRLLRRRAIDGIIHDLEDGQFLFLNIDPHDFDDPTFRNMDPAELGIPDPSRVVLEITERTAIKDYPRFQEYLAAFRERGFRFAVDDAGSGYAGLGSIANLAPDYIKLDISLISNIDTNFLKQNLVETMVGFAEGQGAIVIAEGVERREEFETIKQLGVHLTQGFLFHRPRYSGLNRG